MHIATAKARDTDLLSGSPAPLKKASVNCSEVIGVTKDVNFTSVQHGGSEASRMYTGANLQAKA